MKTKNIFLGLIMCISVAVSAQTNTFYFMEEVPTRNAMNPAFMPNTSFYLDFFILPSFYFEGGTNAFAIRDVLLKNNDNEWVTALHSSQSPNKLYSRIPKTSEIGAKFGLDILNFGFRVKDKNYFNFSLGAKADAAAYLPKDLFKLALFGTPYEDDINSFNLKNLGVNAALYGEVGLGYTMQLTKRITVGAKLKGLVGFAGAFTNFKKLNLNASKEEWELDGQGNAYLITPHLLSWDKENQKFAPNSPEKWTDFIQGFGGAIDLGATWEPIKNLVISAAVTDIGFIRWSKPQDIVQVSASSSFSFKGFEYKVGDKLDGDFFSNAWDSIKSGLLYNYDINSGNKKVSQWLTANVNLGAELGLLKNKLSVGVLSNTRINRAKVMQEVTLAVNIRPIDWFKTYISYTFFDGRYSNLGLGISLRMGAINTFFVMDYIPFSWVKMSNLSENQTKAISLPYGMSRVNLQAGMTLNFGRDSSDKAKNKDKEENKDKKKKKKKEKEKETI